MSPGRVSMRGGFDVKTTDATCPLTSEVHQWAQRLIEGLRMPRIDLVLLVLPSPSTQQNTLLRLLTEPVA